ncbi:MAG: helix-turn-helix domain-containing protein [Candidatus Uhrbacteria bacterium]|nr:helix-turn-helix domain-containing protein [Candidatus Uhrbacteria bacterium]
MKTYRGLKKQLLADKDTRDAYGALGPEFIVIEKLIEKRLKNGVTQGQLAEMIGTKQTAISRFESGRYNPTVGFLFKVAGALGVQLKVTIS